MHRPYLFLEVLIVVILTFIRSTLLTTGHVGRRAHGAGSREPCRLISAQGTDMSDGIPSANSALLEGFEPLSSVVCGLWRLSCDCVT